AGTCPWQQSDHSWQSVFEGQPENGRAVDIEERIRGHQRGAGRLLDGPIQGVGKFLHWSRDLHYVDAHTESLADVGEGLAEHSVPGVRRLKKGSEHPSRGHHLLEQLNPLAKDFLSHD